ncbi:MAG: zinc-dependent metalloprotease [Taibaiella sp.]|nr:zinc-dependent metalloprotease [Taibaiella sp.]
MLKRYLLFLATPFFVGSTYAQKPCGTDEIMRQVRAEHPEVVALEKEMERQIKEGLRKIDFGTAAKTTGVDQSNNPDFWYDIPIVVHIIHDYNTYNTSTFGGDFIPDNFIYEAVKEWNVTLAKQNADTSDVILPFKKWIGNPHIRLHLATVDPNGNPTHGITRRRSYLTYTGGNPAKYDDWAPTSYVNIWFVAKMSSGNSSAAAFALYPSAGASIPYYDGIISLAEYMNKGSKTIPHELGHVMNLKHVWGDTNQPDVACGDDDVDDTPPTKGHSPSGCSASALFDTTCATNYFKIYTSPGGGVELVNYPDTVNAQNIMDYTYCDRMFTKGQVKRMALALNSDIANRKNLWDPANLAATGALAAWPDFAPTPDFNVTTTTGTAYMSKNANFAFPNKPVKFTNFTYGDTVTAMKWEFTNGTNVITATDMNTVTQAFDQPGWVKLKMTATGNNTGDGVKEWEKAVFVADLTGTNPDGYFQEFGPTGDRDKWPYFNYFGNEFKWEMSDKGMWDNNCIMYKGYDERITGFTYPVTGMPKGDYDDLFTVPMDLSAYTGASNYYLNYYYSGASRSSISSSIADTLSIDFSVTNGTSWVNIKKVAKAELCNKGAVSTPWVPTSAADWEPMSVNIPPAARTAYTVFRFRYLPGVEPTYGQSTGNNFYLDRIHFSPNLTQVNAINTKANSIMVVPNPTHGNAFVVINDAAGNDVQVVVTDITGKTVYNTNAKMNGSQDRIAIPASAISVAGMYLVQVSSGNQVSTEKLVVY